MEWLKNLWLKFKATKFFAVLVKVGKAFSKFLRYVYAAQISYLILAGLIWVLTSRFWGIVALTWGVILLVAEIKQQKTNN